MINVPRTTRHGAERVAPRARHSAGRQARRPCDWLADVIDPSKRDVTLRDILSAAGYIPARAGCGRRSTTRIRSGVDLFLPPLPPRRSCFHLSLFVSVVILKNYRTDFHKMQPKGGKQATKEAVAFGVRPNPDHIKVG